MLRPLQTHFFLFQQIFFVLVCIHPGTPRVPPRVLVSGPKPCGAITGNSLLFIVIVAVAVAVLVLVIIIVNCLLLHAMKGHGKPGPSLGLGTYPKPGYPHPLR